MFKQNNKTHKKKMATQIFSRVRGGESVLGRIRGFLVLGMKDKNFNQLKIVQTRHVAYQTKAYCLSFPFL